MWPAATAPGGYLICDGSAVSRTTYAALFAICGTIHGAGDGISTFNLPNLQGRVALGVGQSSEAGATNHSLGQYAGEETHALLVAELAVHYHTLGSHTHDLWHTHTMANHTHVGANHLHDLQNHWHAGANHQHDLSNHTHTYTYVGGTGGIASGGNPYGNVVGGGNTGGPSPNMSGLADRGLNTGGPNPNNTGWADRGLTSAGPSTNTTDGPNSYITDGPSPNYSDNTGSSAGHNTLPPYCALNYIIKS
jgi:microcystin-dependent protein